MDDEQDLWISGDENEVPNSDQGGDSSDPTAFTLSLLSQGGQEGGEQPQSRELQLQQSSDANMDIGYHVRNKEGMIQRKTVSVMMGGSLHKKKPAFAVGCDARAMIHGRMSPDSDKLATLLVYDLKFLSRHGTRIKDADVLFEFRPRSNQPGALSPTVAEVRPRGQIKMGETMQNQASKFGLSFNAGPSIPGADVGLNIFGEQNISKDLSFHTTVTGDNPADLDWGDRFQASFTLAENTSQQSGIPTQLTVVILLQRESDHDFEMVPHIQITPNFTSRLISLGSTRSSDDPVYFNVQEPPFEKARGMAKIDPNNLGAVDLDSLWFCNMYTLYMDEVKKSESRP